MTPEAALVLAEEAALDLSGFTEKAAEPSTMADQDFMAALNKAFQDSEPTTPASSDSDQEPSGEPKAADAERDGGEEEPRS